jgi:hypothetical protein
MVTVAHHREELALDIGQCEHRVLKPGDLD